MKTNLYDPIRLLSSDFWSWPRCVDTDSLFICSRWAVSQSGWHTPESWDKKRYSAGLRWGSLKLSQTHRMVGERIHKMAYLWFEHVWTSPFFPQNPMVYHYFPIRVCIPLSDTPKSKWLGRTGHNQERKELGHNHQTRSRLHIVISNIKWLYPFIFSLYISIYILFICTLYPLYIIYYPIWHISYSNQVSCVLHRSVIFAKIPKFWPIPRMSPDVQHLPQRMCVAIRILEHLMIISIDIGYILDKYWINIEWFGASPLFV